MYSLEAFKKNDLPIYYNEYWNIDNNKKKLIKSCTKVCTKQKRIKIIKEYKKMIKKKK